MQSPLHHHQAENIEGKHAELLSNGDQTAFKHVFNNYYKPLYVLACRYLKDPSLAEDAVQEVFCKLWQHRERINANYPIKAFLFTTAKNHILNILRNDAVTQKRIQAFIESQQTSMDEMDELTARFPMDDLYRLIDQMPKKRRIIVKLKVYKGLENTAVASKLNLSLHTVKFQYYLALKSIKKSMQSVSRCTLPIVFLLLS